MKSKLSIKSILIVAIIAIISLVSFNQCFAADTAKINVDTANIRKKPDATSSIVEQAYKGEKVEILEKSGEWYKVKYNKVEGYLRKDLITEEGQNSTEQTTANTTTANSTTNTTTNTVETNAVSQTTAQTETNNETTNTEKPTSVENTTTVEDTTSTENTEAVSEPVEDTTVDTATEVVQSNGMYTCRETTKLKLLPLIFGKDIKDVETNSAVNVLEINNNWALVESGSDRGWILVNKLVKESNSATIDNTKNQVEDKKEENNEEAKTEESKQEENKQEETTSEVTKYVSSEVVNLRSDESTSSSSLAKLSKGTEVTVVSERNGWSKVNVNGKSGYVASSLLSERKPEDVTSRSLEEARQELAEREEQEAQQQPQQETSQEAQQENAQPQVEQTAQTAQPEQTVQQSVQEQQQNQEKEIQQEEKRIEQQVKQDAKLQAQSSNKGQEVVNYAMQYKGCRYVYGGTSPKGFDCSGFTQYVYKHFGISLNRTAASQASNGKAVSRSNLQPGDVIMFGKSGINHVGIYIGSGKIVHAANPSRGVTIDTINSGYYNTNYVCARRMIN